MDISPNMGLEIPDIGLTPGPEYAQVINANLLRIDAHTHVPGYGVPVPVAGLNINDDLPMGGNSLLNIKSLGFQSQTEALTLPNSLQVIAGELWFTDGTGLPVQITASGSLNVTSASLPGQSYAGGTFIWKQVSPPAAVNTPADMDIGSIILRNNIAGTTYGITVAPPAGLTSTTNFILPLPPSTQASILTMSTSGVVTATAPVDNSTIELVGGASTATLRVKPGGIGTTQLADAAVTYPKREALPFAIASSSSGSFSTTSTSAVIVTNQSITLTGLTVGRRIFIGLTTGDAGLVSYIGLQITSGSSPTATQGNIIFRKDGSQLSLQTLRVSTAGSSIGYIAWYPASSFSHVFAATATSHTIDLRCYLAALVPGTIFFQNVKLYAYQM